MGAKSRILKVQEKKDKKEKIREDRVVKGFYVSEGEVARDEITGWVRRQTKDGRPPRRELLASRISLPSSFYSYEDLANRAAGNPLKQQESDNRHALIFGAVYMIQWHELCDTARAVILEVEDVLRKRDTGISMHSFTSPLNKLF